jgi:hypothetical protein
MFDSQCDLAALVYDQGQDPDDILRGFAADLNSRGHRAVGLVQLGCHDRDSRQLSAMLVHSGEELHLFQDLGPSAEGCRLDVGRLLLAGAKIADAIDQGADLVIVNRFGKQESEGKGLTFLIERALSADTPVVIAVPNNRFPDWLKFSDGMSVKLPCNRAALETWWSTVCHRSSAMAGQDTGQAHRQHHPSVCEVLK